MIKFLIVPTILLALISCGADFSAKSVQIKAIQDTTLIKNWLTKIIIDYLNGNDLKASYNNMQLALTDDYYNYKQDAINLEYGEEMTEEEFHQKWKAKYDTRYVGKGGFFNSAQDNGTIDIPVCTLLKSFGDTAKVFNVVIHDVRWKTDHVCDITVVSRDNQLFINDVKEYD
jgi:hypothetical protein